MYRGVRVTASGSLYRLGLALLDLEDPRRVLRRSDEWVFGPTETYERIGDVGDVVFPCGWVLSGDRLRIYYGAADTSVGMATASLSEILTWLDDDITAIPGQPIRCNNEDRPAAALADVEPGGSSPDHSLALLDPHRSGTNRRARRDRQRPETSPRVSIHEL